MTPADYNIDTVAQWLGWFLDGRLPYDMCPTYGSQVTTLSAMGQPTRPTHPSIPPGSVNE